MKKRLKHFPLCWIIMLCLLSGCQNSGQFLASNDDMASISPAETETPSAKSAIPSETIAPVTEQNIKADLAVVEALLNSVNIQKIYYGPAGTLLVRTLDTLYWYDINSGYTLAQCPVEDWLAVEYYSIENGCCAVGPLAPDESTEGFSSDVAAPACIFYDETLQEIRRIILNDLGDGVDYVKCAAVSSNGNAIAYCTMDKLYYYDCTSDTLKLVLDFSRSQIEVNKGLSSIATLAFSPDGSEILFGANTYSLPIAIGQHSFLTYGCISLDGGNLQNLSFQNFEAGSMAGMAEGFLFFEESMKSATGNIAVVSSHDMTQKVYSLNTVSEGVSGLFCSQNGDYYATVKSETGQWLIRIYSRETGELVIAKAVKETNEEFFYRTPAIYILDDSELCIVKLGGFSDIPSKVIAFSLLKG